MRLTYANVVATLALFLALTRGAAYAVGKIDSGEIAAGAIHTTNLHKRAVTSGKLALGAVRSNQIASGAVGSAQIAAGAVGTSQIAAGTIGSDQIRKSSVTPGNLQFPVSFLASPSAGSAAVPDEGEGSAYPIADGSWTQHPGGVNVIFGAATATLAYGQGSCQAIIELGLRGEGEGGESGGGLQTESIAPVQIEANLGGLPLMDPAALTTRRLSARIRSNGGCTEASTIDSARFRVLDFG